MVMVTLDSPLGCLVSLLLKLHQSEAVPHTVHSRLGGGLQKEDILGREGGREGGRERENRDDTSEQ